MLIGKNKATALFIGNEQIKAEGIRELKKNVSFEEAARLTANNGLDEIYFRTAEGRNYLAYGDGLSLKQIKKGMPAVFNGEKAKIEYVDNEVNTFTEGLKYGLGKMKESAYSFAKDGVCVAGIGAVAETLIGVGGILTGVGTALVLGSGVIAVGGAVAGGIHAATRRNDYRTVKIVTQEQG